MSSFSNKAIITAAGVYHRHLPVQTLTGREGYAVTTLFSQILELVDAGIQEIGMVISPGTENLYREAAGEHVDKLSFIVQHERLGYGHAVSLTRDWVGNDDFILMVGDHIFVSQDPRKNCVTQVIEPYLSERCPVSAVQSTHESQIRFFGTIGGEYFDANRSLYRIHQVTEKPTPTEAEERLWVPGMRGGYYLCFFGIHLLTPRIFDYLLPLKDGKGFTGFSEALQAYGRDVQYLAVELKGKRYDLENRHGLLFAQLALALDSKHRDEVLSGLIELLAASKQKDLRA
jgi:UTP--glucose-1-phosphate uridylyltransferase